MRTHGPVSRSDRAVDLPQPPRHPVVDAQQHRNRGSALWTGKSGHTGHVRGRGSPVERGDHVEQARHFAGCDVTKEAQRHMQIASRHWSDARIVRT